MSGPSPDSKETGSENEEGDELDSFLLQNEKISILNAWAKDQLANDGKVIDWSKESTFFGLTFQLKNSMLRNYYPEMPQVVRIFWSFLCTARFFDSINIILTAPANEILLKQLGHEEWEAAITATVSGYPSEQGDELPINATAKQKCADKLLRNLINLVPKNLSPDVWDKGSLLTAKIGTGRAFSLLAAADKITLRPAYMLRVAADSNHWEILNKIMGLSLLEGQQYRAMMYRSLYMLQKAVAGNQNHIVNQIMSEWRNDETTSFIEKWRIACEMASGRGNLAFLQMLFQKREFGETELAGASLNMLSLALQGKYFSVVEFLLKEPAKADKFFLSKITQGPTIYKSLILAFAETTHEEIEREMKETGGFGSSSTVEAIALEANAIRFALSRPGVSKTDPSIIDALQRTYTKGNHEIGQIAQDLDISFAWMEPSASTLTRKSWKTTLEKPKKPQAQEDGSMAEYSAMISALGLVDSEMISNADFEVHQSFINIFRNSSNLSKPENRKYFREEDPLHEKRQSHEIRVFWWIQRIMLGPSISPERN